MQETFVLDKKIDGIMEKIKPHTVPQFPHLLTRVIAYGVIMWVKSV